MSHMITVISLGPGDPDLLNMKTIRVLKCAELLILLTERHAVADWLKSEHVPFETLDFLYESSDDFDQFHQAAFHYIINKAEICSVVFAVPDACSDRTVRMLVQSASDHLTVSVVPGTGYHDVFLSDALGHFNGSDLRVATAYDFLSESYNPNLPLLLLEIDNEILAGQLKVHLSSLQDDEFQILFLRAGTPPAMIPLYALDRQSLYDHQTAALIPPADYMHRKRFVLEDLIRIMEKLSSPDGCPWDSRQTHLTLRPYLAEEAWECIACIDQNDMDHLSEELGDLLLQIVFHSCIGKKYDEFTMDDVISAICMKMIRRHPHVFSDMDPQVAEMNPGLWEQLKQKETGHTGIVSSMEDVSTALPSLKYAEKIFKKISILPAFKREPASIEKEIRQILLRIDQPVSSDRERTFGLLLLLIAELGFRLGYDSELLLHRATDNLKKKLQNDCSSSPRNGKTTERLTFTELGVYLDHVEGEIE